MIKLYKNLLMGLIMIATLSSISFAQSDTVTIINDEIIVGVKPTPKDWHLLDRDETGFYGISLGKAYDFLKGRNSKTVLVAVIDSGIDTLHEDLKPVLWRNPGEIPGNGIDDDKKWLCG